MQKIFRDAETHLRMDMTFASSPCGSIASRLPCQDESMTPNEQSSVPDDGPNIDWRYSTAPERCAGADVDVREPVGVDSPYLPSLPLSSLSDRNAQHEPISSGFTTPAHQGQSSPYCQAPSLSTLDKSYGAARRRCSKENRSVSRSRADDPSCHTSSCSSDDDFLTESHGVPLAFPMKRTELERPMSRLGVSVADAWLDDVLGNASSPHKVPPAEPGLTNCPLGVSTNESIPQLPIQSAVSDSDVIPRDDTGIELSSSSHAATTSAKKKRDKGIESSASVNLLELNKENIPPSSTDPQMSFEYQATPIRRFRGHSLNIPFRRVNSSGSPLPLLKTPTKIKDSNSDLFRRPSDTHPTEADLTGNVENQNDSSVVLTTCGSAKRPHTLDSTSILVDKLTDHQTQPPRNVSPAIVRGKGTRTLGKSKKIGAAKFYKNDLATVSGIRSIKRPRESPRQSPNRPVFRSSPIRDGHASGILPESKRHRGHSFQADVSLRRPGSSRFRNQVKGSSFSVYDEEAKEAREITNEVEEEELRQLNPNVDITPRGKKKRMGMVFPRRQKERSSGYNDEDISLDPANERTMSGKKTTQ